MPLELELKTHTDIYFEVHNVPFYFICCRSLCLRCLLHTHKKIHRIKCRENEKFAIKIGKSEKKTSAIFSLK